MAHSLGALAELVGARVVGDTSIEVDRVATLAQAGPGAIAFLANPRYREQLAATRAGAVILTESDLADCPVPALVTDDPYRAYARIAGRLYPQPRPVPGVHPSAVIDPAARIDASACIGPHCVVGADSVLGPQVVLGPGCTVGARCELGEGSRLAARVTLCDDVRLGRRVQIHPGAVLGADGFGLAQEEGRWIKVPQLGGVRVGDDVEIGANTTIDRGALEDTVIEEGAKLDNQIQVAHNVFIGAHSALAGCVGISGSARIGRHCMLGGGVGVVGHLSIADGTVVTGFSMVTKDITEPGVYSSGVPAEPRSRWNRALANLRRLERLTRRIARLEKKIDSSD